MKTYLTADLHLGHKNIIDYCNRPFSGLDQMHEYLLAQIQEAVDPGDELWILGDLTGPHTFDDLRSFLAQIPCPIHWIEGNHAPDLDKISDLVEHEGHYAEIKSGIKNAEGYGLSIALSHYPMVRWNGSAHGHFHAHGHVHDGLREKNLGERRMDVGVDAQGFKPISVKDLALVLKQVTPPKDREK